MGPIQSSLNQLTLSAIGAIGGVAYGFKGGFKKPVTPKAEQPASEQLTEQPKTETSSSMGNVAKIGRDYSRKNFGSYLAAAQAVNSGNDTIEQKARSINPVENRLNEIKSSIRQKMIENINNSAKEEFGTTDDFSKSIYMLPNGEMIDGTYKGATKQRSVEHNDIYSAYEANNYSLKDSNSSTDYMLDYMKKGNIRMLPETKSIDIMSKPTSEQMNMIYRMFNEGKLDSINVTKSDSKYGESADYLKEIKSESQISNFIRKNFQGGSK